VITHASAAARDSIFYIAPSTATIIISEGVSPTAAGEAQLSCREREVKEVSVRCKTKTENELGIIRHGSGK